MLRCCQATADVAAFQRAVGPLHVTRWVLWVKRRQIFSDLSIFLSGFLV